MKTIQLIGRVDENHRLQADVPGDITPGDVRLVLLIPEEEDNEFSNSWAEGIAREWAEELNDPREDIYTLEDGEPLDGRG